VLLSQAAPAAALVVSPYFAGHSTIDATTQAFEYRANVGFDYLPGETQLVIDVEHGMVGDGGLASDITPGNWGFDYNVWAPAGPCRHGRRCGAGGDRASCSMGRLCIAPEDEKEGRGAALGSLPWTPGPGGWYAVPHYMGPSPVRQAMAGQALNLTGSEYAPEASPAPP
jgi:hypothetical protein